MEQNKSMSRRDALKTLGAIVATAVLSTTPLSAITVPEKKENGLLHSGKRKGKRLIFYFTATGNSLYVARELAGESGQLYSIPQIIKDKHLDYEADEIGFVFPDYAATAPLMVREFVSKAHFKAQYIFSVITFGNFAANVADWWNDFCKEKSLQNHYINTLLMEDNYLPVFDMNEQVKIDKKIPENLAAIVGDIHEHKQFIAHFEQMDERMQDFLKRLQDSDGIASWRTMQSRLESLSALGIPTEFHSYSGLPHGFGLGTGTIAEGWLIDAVRFWQQQSGANDIRSAKANTRQQNSIYSLNGTRRNAIQKGINIVDGKKVAF